LAADITSIAISNGQVYITYSGVSNRTYVVQTSSNLQDWVDVVTNSAAADLFSFLDTGGTNFNRRFYRALFNLDSGDVVAPVWAGGGTLATSDVKFSGFTLSWGGATDDTEIVCYGIYADGELIGSVDGSDTNLMLTGLLPGREYNLVIEACDSGGNCTTTGPAIVTHTALQQEPPRSPSVGIDRNDNPGSLLLHSGECVKRRADMAIAGRRMGFRFARTYRSAVE
jgi:hypothetical protein